MNLIFQKSLTVRLTLALLACISISVFHSSDIHAQPSSKRIVSLGGGVTETLFALGVGEQIVAVDVSSVYPKAATKKPKVGYIRATSAEGIASMKPSVVIASEALGPKSVHAQLKAADIKVELVPEARSIQSALERIQQLGKLVNREKNAELLIKRIKTVMEQPLPSGKAPRVLFLFAHGGSGFMVAGKNTAANTMIKAAGGINSVDAYEGYRPLTAEAVLSAKPDLILLTERSLNAAQGQNALWKMAGMSLTPAGKNKRAIVIEDLKLLGFGPRIGEALQELRRGFFHR